MKKLILISILIFSSKLFGQQYVSFPTNGIWHQLRELQNGGSSVSRINYSLILNGDTTILNRHYYKLYSKQNQLEFIGAIRETPQKEIFYYATSDSMERMIYKFGLTVGDSLNIRRYASEKAIKVVSIDSILVGNSFRKRYLMTTPTLSFNQRDYWIEGIGSVKGLFYPYSGQEFENIESLLCFERNSVVEFRNTKINYGCAVPTNELAPLIVDVYPNPANELIKFQLFNSPVNSFELKIFDVIGHLIAQHKIDNNYFEIETNTLVNGIYFYELIHQNNKKIGKFIIQK